jgi:hypothetical protein
MQKRVAAGEVNVGFKTHVFTHFESLVYYRNHAFKWHGCKIAGFAFGKNIAMRASLIALIGDMKLERKAFHKIPSKKKVFMRAPGACRTQGVMLVWLPAWGYSMNVLLLRVCASAAARKLWILTTTTGYTFRILATATCGTFRVCASAAARNSPHSNTFQIFGHKSLLT